MSVRMLLTAIVVLLASRYFEKVRAQAVGNLTEHLPDGLPTTQSAGVISASVSVPASDSTVDLRVDAIVFWIGCTLVMLLLASCAACHICRCSERRRNSSRRGRRGPSREPVPQVETSRTTVHPQIPRTGIVLSPPTYGTARLPFPSPGASTQDRPPISPWGTHPSRVGYYDLRSSVLDQRREEDDFGYQSQPLQPASNGLPSHGSAAFGSTLRPPVAPWRDLGSPYPTAAIGLHRSAPPANDFRGYQW